VGDSRALAGKGPAVLLHLSDLHFGRTGDETQSALRKAVLGSLARQVLAQPPDWRATIVCVSGDIGWAGREADYHDAEGWLSEFLLKLGLAPEQLVVCPGNHDIDREKAKRRCRPPNVKEADDALSVPIDLSHAEPFREYEAFCQRMGMPLLHIGDSASYLVGIRDLGGARLLVCNSWPG